MPSARPSDAAAHDTDAQDTAAPPPGGVLALVNAGAGSASAPVVRSVIAEMGRTCDVELRRTASLDDLRDALLAGAGRRLVLLGGDGSLHAALQLLHRAGAARDVGPLGIVPLGTGNDLARSLRLPLDPAAAARVAVTGRPKDLELLVDSRGRTTVNTVHAGIGASATARAQALKPRLKAAAYPVGAVWAGIRAGAGYHLRVAVDGEVLNDGRSPLLVVGIGLGGTIGGGTRLVPDADPHDGIADVVVSTSTGPLARIGFAAGLRTGVHVERQDVLTAKGRVVEVTALQGSFRLNSDGEVTEPQQHERFEMHRDAWQVVCPA